MCCYECLSLTNPVRQRQTTEESGRLLATRRRRRVAPVVEHGVSISFTSVGSWTLTAGDRCRTQGLSGEYGGAGAPRSSQWLSPVAGSSTLR